MRREGYVALMGEIINLYEIFVSKPQGMGRTGIPKLVVAFPSYTSDLHLRFRLSLREASTDPRYQGRR
jgi:hypothetical protein